MEKLRPLYELILNSEDWLLNRIVGYARERGFTKYTSTLVEAWRASVEGVTKSLLIALVEYDHAPEIGPDDDYAKDPVSAFGILEAKLHRQRGISLKMFIGLMKYYRQAYDDCIAGSDFSTDYKEQYRLFVKRCFDRIELGFCTEWCSLSEHAKTEELQATNRAITNEKNKYLTIFESLHDPVLFLDKDNLIENMNSAAYEVFYSGGLPGQIYYAESHEKIPFPVLNQELARLASGGIDELQFDKFVVTVKGERNFQIKMKSMLDVSKKFSGTVVIFSDITARQQAEVALQDAKETAEKYLSISAELIFSLDTRGTILMMNESGHMLLGYNPGELIGRNWFDTCLPEEIRPEIWAVFQKLMQGDIANVVSYENTVIKKNGSIRLLLWHNSLLKDLNGKIKGLLSSAQDITGRKKAEDALAHQTWLLGERNKELNCLYQTATVLDYSNESLDEVIEKAVHLVPTGWQYPGIACARIVIGEQVFATQNFLESPWSLSADIVASGKVVGLVEVRYLKETAACDEGPFLKEEKKLIGNLALIYGNMVERKQAEEAIQNKNAELERLTYTVSHNLKSPLITFKTYLGFLEQDMITADADTIKQDIGFMQSAAGKMDSMIGDILELSRAGQISHKSVRVAVRELVDEAVAAVAGQIAQKKVSLQVDLPHVTLYGDRQRLAEIWQNLIDNAVKYIGGQKDPGIVLGAELSQGETVFYVRDNGMGIDPRHQDKVFGLFSKLDPKSEGSGVGLAIVKRIVEMYKGRIWLESEGPGKGTCFKFTLPEAVRSQAVPLSKKPERMNVAYG